MDLRKYSNVEVWPLSYGSPYTQIIAHGSYNCLSVMFDHYSRDIKRGGLPEALLQYAGRYSRAKSGNNHFTRHDSTYRLLKEYLGADVNSSSR
jgi:hypothetical protein